jgi:hypothetical protein
MKTAMILPSRDLLRFHFDILLLFVFARPGKENGKASSRGRLGLGNSDVAMACQGRQSL